MEARPDVQYRYLIQPTADLMPFYDMLNFDPKTTRPVYEKGVEDAQKVIEMGPGVSFNKLRVN